MWRPVRVFRRDNIPTPLMFGAWVQRRPTSGRNQPGAVRIVRVTEDGEREVVEAGCS